MNRVLHRLFSNARLLAFLTLACLAGCESASDRKPHVPVTQPQSSDTLRVGDRIRIIYLDIPDAPAQPTEQQIPEDGKLLLPKGVEIGFAGKKRTDVEREIQDTYVNKRRLYPRMTVIIERLNLIVSVGGEVRTPGFVPHSGEMTLTRAINAANGFTEFAERTAVLVTRATTKEQIVVDVKKALKDPSLDVPIYPGDVIHVKRKIL